MLDKKSILFVDDERNILSSLRRSLRHEGWNLLFANSGQEGLDMLDRHGVDLVVADICMPGMDGVAFLKQVQKKHPDITRLVLTGYADRKAVRTAFTEVDIQAMIPKPWEEVELCDAIRQALFQTDAQEKLSPGLHRIINSLHQLPSPPAAYQAVHRAIRAQPDLDASHVAELLLATPAIAARVLKVANSAYFGQCREIDTLSQAVVVLGLDIVESLVLTASLAQSMPCDPALGLGAEDLCQHSLTCSAIAHHLAARYSDSPRLQNAAVLAGSLHDMGKLVLAHYRSEVYAAVIDRANRCSIPLYAAEREVLETDHAMLGSFIAQWWNFPNRIVEAVGFHHAPDQALSAPLLTHLIHLSDTLAHQLNPMVSTPGTHPQPCPATLQLFDLDYPGALDEIVEQLRASGLCFDE